MLVSGQKKKEREKEKKKKKRKETGAEGRREN